MRTKFQCVDVVRGADWRSVILHSLNDGTVEAWKRDTPQVVISIPITSPDHFEAFEVGKNYFVHFVEAYDEPAGIQESQPANEPPRAGQHGESAPQTAEPASAESQPQALPREGDEVPRQVLKPLRKR